MKPELGLEGEAAGRAGNPHGGGGRRNLGTPLGGPRDACVLSSAAMLPIATNSGFRQRLLSASVSQEPGHMWWVSRRGFWVATQLLARAVLHPRLGLVRSQAVADSFPGSCVT